VRLRLDRLSHNRVRRLPRRAAAEARTWRDDRLRQPAVEGSGRARRARSRHRRTARIQSPHHHRPAPAHDRAAARRWTRRIARAMKKRRRVNAGASDLRCCCCCAAYFELVAFAVATAALIVPFTGTTTFGLSLWFV